MAFGVGRFVAYFVLGAALVTAGVVGIADATRFDFDPQHSNSAQATRLASALAVLERRDSIVRALRAVPPRPGLSIVLPATMVPKVRTAAAEMIHRFWRDAVGEAGRVPVIVLVPAGAGRAPYPKVHPQSVDYVLLPSMTDGRTCVIVLSSAMVDSTRPVRNLGPVATRMRQHAGACVFLAKYGAPGPAMAQWLASAAWNPARLAIAGADSADTQSPSVQGDVRPPRSSRTAVLWYVYGYFHDFRLDAAHFSCLAGHAAMCAQDGVARPPFGLRGPTWSESLVPAGVMAVPKYWRTRARPDDGLLSIVEAAIGRERFAALWATDRPIPDAIREASGASIGELVSQLLRRSIPPLASTPWPSPIEWLVNLGIIAALIAVVARTRRRSA